MRDINGWTPDDYAALVAMANEEGAPAEWFASVMMSESSMQHDALNASGAQGLIQFAGLSQNIRSLTPAQQMPLIQAYYAPKRPPGGWISRAQIYQANYLPATIKTKGSDLSTVLSVRGDGNYQGPIFDHTNKGFTTVGDLETRLEDVTQGAHWNAVLTGIATAGGAPANVMTAPNPFVIILGGLALGAAGYYLVEEMSAVKRAYGRRPVRRPMRRRAAA